MCDVTGHPVAVSENQVDLWEMIPSESDGALCIWCARPLPPCVSFSDIAKSTISTRYGDKLDAYVFNGPSRALRRRGLGQYYRIRGLFEGEWFGDVPGYYLCPGCLCQQFIELPTPSNVGYHLTLNDGWTPVNAASFGHQFDSGEYRLAVAHTLRGNIPGKARGKTCWYADVTTANEHNTERFSWVVEPTDCALWLVDAGNVKPTSGGYVIEGYRSSDMTSSRCYSAVARTDKWGIIPGMTTDDRTRCVFTYNGCVYETESFYVVVTDSRCVSAHVGLMPSASGQGHVAIPRPMYRASVRVGYVYELSYEAMEVEVPTDGCVSRHMDDAVTVVRQWDFTSLRQRGRSELYSSRDVQLVYQTTYETDDRRRYAVLVVDAEDLERRQRLAAAHVELDVDFGRQLITRALLDSLQSMSVGGQHLAVRLSLDRIPPGTGDVRVTLQDDDTEPTKIITRHSRHWFTVITKHGCSCVLVAAVVGVFSYFVFKTFYKSYFATFLSRIKPP